MKKFSIAIISVILLTSTFCLWNEYSSELQQAYKWAYENEITTMTSIDKANMKWNITREEMAKMISNFSKNILWTNPDTTRPCLFINSNINPTLVQSVTESCQLWLMWQWITFFKPTDFVTRAEFWTILSRALRWDEYEWWTTYYQNHLKALKNKWIMNNITSPMDNEIRGYVMIMLMRTSDFQTNTTNNTMMDDQISEVIEMLD